MNRQETARILAYLKAAYPSAYGKLTTGDIETMLNLWTIQFSSYDYDIVFKAVNEFIALDNVGYVPAIGQIKTLISASNNKYVNQFEAWELIKKALRNSGTHYMEEYEKLPVEVQKTVGNARVLRQWALTDVSQLSFIENSFKKEFRETVNELTNGETVNRVNIALTCDSGIKRIDKKENK